MRRMIAVSASGLYRRHGRRWALADVGFELPQGSIALITGHNGAGKTTLLRVIATALRPDRGTVRVEGRDVRDDRDGARARVAFLADRPQLYDSLTAIENLAVRARFLAAPAARGALIERLAEVGLESHADQPVRTFSAGMRQRLALAAVLQKDAPVVLLDEPYEHLDATGVDLVDGLMTRMRAAGKTVVVATHAPQGAAALADHRLTLEAGRVREPG